MQSKTHSCFCQPTAQPARTCNCTAVGTVTLQKLANYNPKLLRRALLLCAQFTVNSQDRPAGIQKSFKTCRHRGTMLQPGLTWQCWHWRHYYARMWRLTALSAQPEPEASWTRQHTCAHLYSLCVGSPTKPLCSKPYAGCCCPQFATRRQSTFAGWAVVALAPSFFTHKHIFLGWQASQCSKNVKRWAEKRTHATHRCKPIGTRH